MVGRFKLSLLTFATAALAFAPAGSLRAQQAGQPGGRFRVLIPPFHPTQNAGEGFGKDAAKKLRDLVNTLATHQPVDEKDVEKAVKRFKLKMKDLNCVTTRQLATRLNAKVALCAEYHSEDGNKREVVDATFYAVGNSESFKVDQASFPRNKPDSAAQYIFRAFDTYVQEIRAAQFCNEYASSQDYQQAIGQCDKAIRINPRAIGARYTRAHIYFEQNQYDSAMTELEKVLQQNPNHEDALQLAGYISAKQGNDQQARKYYQHYLELNPSDVNVRMSIAFQLDTAGDPAGALQLIETGLKVDPNNADLLEQYAGFAFAAAVDIENKKPGSDTAGVAAEARPYFQEAVDAGQKVFKVRGKDTRVGLLTNTILALDKLGEQDRAIQLAQQAIQAHGGQSQLWSAYAEALHTNGQLDSAIVALDSVRALDPSDQVTSLKEGDWLITAGRLADAVKVLKSSAAQGQQQAEQAAEMIFADAYNNGIRKDRYAYAEQGLSAARGLPNLSAGTQHKLTFWQAYAIYQAAIVEQKPNTLKTARATLPKFEQALALLKHVGNYPASVHVVMKQLVNNLNTYIDIQQAIIKRGR